MLRIVQFIFGKVSWSLQTLIPSKRKRMVSEKNRYTIRLIRSLCADLEIPQAL